MKLNIAISSSAGYTRALEIKQGGGKKIDDNTKDYAPPTVPYPYL